MKNRILVATFAGLLFAPLARAEDKKPEAAGPVSFHKQVRPIFQAHCQGCHQPAKPSGEYVMTDFARLLKGGETGETAVVAGQPAKSHLVTSITPAKDGKAEMPKGKPALPASDIELISRWIAEGAKDDTPAAAQQRYDMEHPPVYKRPPVITSLDFSPDGKLLAVAGFNEVLLVNVDSGERVARLVGLSERLESVRFSPDGKRLLVTGGLPGMMGEVQVWDVEKRTLTLSVPVTFDTIYGGSWSPDGKSIGFGCADNTCRVVDATTGQQTLQQGTHSDWVLDTAFSPSGNHLVSVSRDMTAKLTEVATQRFVDNITSITPGALKGGMQAVAMHPTREEIIVGAADGEPKLYRIQRTTARQIGDDANLLRKLPKMTGRVYSVAFSRDGNRIVAASGLNGVGQVFISAYDPKANIKYVPRKGKGKPRTADVPPPEATVQPSEIVKTELPVTVYAVAFHPDSNLVAAAGSDGVVRFIDALDGKIEQEISPAPVAPASTQVAAHVDFLRDVAPVLSRLGCNAGTCHGAAKGKAGFKLSLRGYDAGFDVLAFTEEQASRRVNVSSPEDSLMLLKATNAVPHVGGQLTKPGEKYYEIIRGWIAGGAKLDPQTPRVTQIVVTPANPSIEKLGGKQPLKVVATYADGLTRDVTREAFLESGNTEVATVDREAVVTSLRRGEAPVLVRYEGAYTATLLTVMGDRTGFTWEQPPTYGRLDELVAAKWLRMKIKPSDLCTDAEFLRRVSLDLTGLPPKAEEVEAFLADSRDSRVKRDEYVDKLIGNDDYLDHWTNKWADLLQVNRKFLGPEGAAAFRTWIRGELAANTPYDELARKVITASGSNKENPAASYFKILRDAPSTMENTTHLFLGVRFNCNKCHDHPFEKWTQDQYYQTAAYFAQFELKKDPASGDKNIGGTAVEGAKPLYEIVADKPAGEVNHERTGQPTPPQFPFACGYEAPEKPTRRQQLAAWLSSKENPYFAKSYVNRLWGYLFGVGIMEPIDDLRAGNPPTNPELLEHLTQAFIESRFDVRAMHRLICKSRTYQLSYEANDWNRDDRLNYSHALPRRLSAEALYDAVHRVTGTVSKLPGVPAGTRAAAIPDVGVELPSGFFTTFGRPVRESACECERSSGLQLGPVMALVSGPTIAEAIGDPKNEIARLVASEKDDRKLIAALFVRVLNRHATDKEIEIVLQSMERIATDHEKLAAALAERQAKSADLKAELEKQREAAIAKAKAELEGYQASIAERVAAAEKARSEEIARREAAVKEYDGKIPELLDAYAKKQTPDFTWTQLAPMSIAPIKDVKTTIAPDNSVFVEGQGKVAIEVLLPTTLRKITGLRLEALADDRLPKSGPGRAPDGNFVLTEIEVFAAPSTDPTKFAKVELHKPLADFEQENYPISKAIDGNPNDGGTGWAVSPVAGLTHWATFETKQPVDHEAGTVLKVVLHHKFNQPPFLLGRFRLSAVAEKTNIGLTIADDLRELLAKPVAERDDKQQQLLARFIRSADGEFKNREKALNQARQPLPGDPRVKELQEQVDLASKPVPPDAKLAQLQQDADMSTKQLADKRLTAAQDVVWALINSPAFLFNR